MSGGMVRVEIRFNPDLDVASLTADFADKGRVQIRNVLVADCADEIYRCLLQDVPWSLAYNEGKENHLIPMAEFQATSLNEQMKFQQGVFDRAGSEFQFTYLNYMMVDAYLEKRDLHLIPLHTMVEFLNTPSNLDVIRKITGISEIKKGEAQATWYRPNNFLTVHHDDATPENGRLVAFVFGFTKNWRPDWGGYLQFYDADGNVAEAFKPDYNVLNMFRVPRDHSVSFVTPFAGAPRLSITGWFRDR